MSRKMYVDVKVRLIVDADEDIDLPSIVNEMDYSFSDQTGKAEIVDTQILDWECVDSK